MATQPRCYVYWIHRSCEDDITTQGYVGITNNFQKRFKDHKKAAANLKKNHALYNSMNKYDDFLFEVVLVSTRLYCLDIENKLRPIKNIGLNHAAGGSFVKDQKVVTCDTKQKLRLASIEAHKKNPDLARKQSERLSGRLLSDQHKLNISKSGKGKQVGWKNPKAKPEVWCYAFQMYKHYENNSNITYYALSKFFNLEIYQSASILKSFQSGWNPFNDQEFIKYIKENLSCQSQGHILTLLKS